MTPKRALIQLCQENNMFVIVNRGGQTVELWSMPGTHLECGSHCYVEQDWRAALEMARHIVKHGGPHACADDCECHDEAPEPYGCRLIESNVWES